MRIAVVQFHIDHKDKESNLERAEDFMSKATKNNSDLIVFPEYFIGGPGKRMIEKTKPGVAVDRFRQLARKYKIDIVPGTLMERDPTDGHTYNTAYYIDQSGEVLLSYRKVHLWHAERTYLKKGENRYPTAKNRFGIEVGLVVCWDIAFSAAFREMALNRKAQLIIAPAYWGVGNGNDELPSTYDPSYDVRMLNTISIARCFEYGIVFVLCNPAHESKVERKQPFGPMIGNTQIAVPFKGPIAHCNHRREEMIIADVDIKAITDDSEVFHKIRKDWDEGLVYDERAQSRL